MLFFQDSIAATKQNPIRSPDAYLVYFNSDENASQKKNKKKGKTSNRNATVMAQWSGDS
jgi:hypothetical protein